MRFSLAFIFLICIFTKSLAVSSGPNKGYTVIHDFKYDWLEYDNDVKQFVPQISEKNSNLKVHSLSINLNDYPSAYILIQVNSGDNYLFFNKLLFKKLSNAKWEVFQVDKLKAVSPKGNLILSIYGDNNIDNKIVFIGYPTTNSHQEVQLAKKKGLLNYYPRNSSSYSSSMVLIFIISTVMVSFLSNNYNKAFKKFFNYSDIAGTDFKNESFLLNKPLDRPNLLFVILLSFLTGFILQMLQSRGVVLLGQDGIFQGGDSFGILVSNFFKVSLLIFILYILKFFFINIIAALFNIEKVVELHYFKLIQLTLMVYAAFLIFLLFCQNIFIINNLNLKNILLYGSILFYAFRTIMIYFTLNRNGSIKILYLISYLCIVEVLPIVVGIKFIS